MIKLISFHTDFLCVIFIELHIKFIGNCHFNQLNIYFKICIESPQTDFIVIYFKSDLPKIFIKTFIPWPRKTTPNHNPNLSEGPPPCLKLLQKASSSLHKPKREELSGPEPWPRLLKREWHSLHKNPKNISLLMTLQAILFSLMQLKTKSKRKPPKAKH